MSLKKWLNRNKKKKSTQVLFEKFQKNSKKTAERNILERLGLCKKYLEQPQPRSVVRTRSKFSHRKTNLYQKQKKIMGIGSIPPKQNVIEKWIESPTKLGEISRETNKKCKKNPSKLPVIKKINLPKNNSILRGKLKLCAHKSFRKPSYIHLIEDNSCFEKRTQSKVN